MDKYKVLKEFRYKGKTHLPGRYIYLEGEEAEKLAGQNKVKGPHKTKIDGPNMWKCGNCERSFDTPQGKAAHERFCR